jgi:hypothetical protein
LVEACNPETSAEDLPKCKSAVAKILIGIG